MSTAPVLDVPELIVKKRDGGSLSSAEIESLIDGYTSGAIPDYQVSAFLMAAFLRGLDEEETFSLTESMLNSGKRVDLSAIDGKKVDKHSTGGVGDKVSLVLAPLVGACGVPVPMISGRGLGHTGGTLDKLESIPGFKTDLGIDEFRRLLAATGVALIGQTADIAPADRKLYALRDVTGTVEYIPFIVASILSKKIAEGIDSLVLDVKVGSGAFMTDESDARTLAETLVRVSQRFGVESVAVLTDMDSPLGMAIGNWPEVVESIQCLEGEGPEDVMEVVTELAAEMLVMGGAAAGKAEAVARARQAIRTGAALAKFEEIVLAQGGDLEAIKHPEIRLAKATSLEVSVPKGFHGFVHSIDTRALGNTAVAMGAGRQRKEDPVDPLCGIVLEASKGSYVQPGAPLARLYTGSGVDLSIFARRVISAFAFSESPPPVRRLVRARFDGSRWTEA